MRQSAPDRFGRIKAHPPHASPGQAIGLLGGSFNPPHAAHRMISETALKRLGLDKVWWIVTPGNPLKKWSDLAPLSERLILCRKMATNPHIEITAFESDLPTPYTVSTLAFLKARSPLVRFVWIMGADNLASLDRWERWREIFSMFPIAVVDRPGWRLKALASKAARVYSGSRLPEMQARMLPHTPPPAWTFLTGPLSQVSSTDLRAKGRLRGISVAKKAHQPPTGLPWKRPKSQPSRNSQAEPGLRDEKRQSDTLERAGDQDLSSV
jgi:nicotinate-nucleotide adenylyltransferase